MSTMKIAIIFALIGVSLCNDETSEAKCDSPFKGDHTKQKDCLKYTLEHAPVMIKALEAVFCKYIDNQVYRKKELYEEAKKEMRKVTACSGCTLGILLGVPVTLEDVGNELGIVAGEAAQTVADTTEALHISELFASVICIVLRGVLGTECKEKFKTVTGKESARELSCEAQKDNPDMLVVLGHLGEIGCIEKEALILVQKGEKGSDLVRNLLELNLGHLVNDLMEILGDTITSVSCLLGSILS